MTTVVEKIIKTRGLAPAILTGIHYTSTYRELTNRHVAILEEFATPLKEDTNFILDSAGMPMEGFYPYVKRLVDGVKGKHTLSVAETALRDLIKQDKKGHTGFDPATGNMVLYDKNNTILTTVENVVEFTGSLDEPVYYANNYLQLLVDYKKEAKLDGDVVIKLDSAIEPAVSQGKGTFLFTPIRITPIRILK